MPQLLAVQVLRALAALAVVIHHAQFDAAAVAARTGQAWAPSELLPWLGGVDVFFVISGFIMVHASLSLFGRPGGTRLFLARRIARIVPLYWAVTTLFLAVAALAPRSLNSAAPGAAEILASYLFVPHARADGEVQPVYSLGWTLNYEMFFYVLFALALPLPKVRAVLAVTAVLAAGVLAGQMLAPLPEPLASWTNPLVFEFVFGMGLALVRSRGLALPLAARLALVGAALVLFHADLARPEAAWLLPRFVAYGVPAAMLVAAATLAPEPARPPRFERALASFGDASYALYLIHPFIIRTLREIVLRGATAALGPWPFVLASVALALAASLAVHRLFEQPVTRLLRRRLRA